MRDGELMSTVMTSVRESAAALVEYFSTLTVETTGWYALGIPLLAAFFVYELIAARRRNLSIYSFAEAHSNLSAGLSTLLVGVLIGPFVLELWDWAQSLSPMRWAQTGWWRFPLALIMADACYYFYHRMGHRFAACWAVHAVHHQHEKLNSTVGLRLEWFADPIAMPVFGLMPLLGCDSTMGFFAIAVLSLYTLTAHAPTLERPTLGIFVTPGVHGTHHSRDARFVGKNYGAMFSIWDRLLGTYRAPVPLNELSDDVQSVWHSHDGVSAQFTTWRALIAQVRRDGLSALWAWPMLDGVPGPLARNEVTLCRSEQAVVLAEFAMVTAFGAWLMWLRDDHALATLVFGIVACVLVLRAHGARLDRRERAGAELVVGYAAMALLCGYLLTANVVVAQLLAASLFALALGRMQLMRTGRLTFRPAASK